MLTERDLKTAKSFGITEQILKLDSELMAIADASDVVYDLSSLWSDIPYIIFLPAYSGIPVSAEDYWDRRHKLFVSVLEVAQKNGLSRTGDRIEDYGAHWYIVMRCDWPLPKVSEVES